MEHIIKNGKDIHLMKKHLDMSYLIRLSSFFKFRLALRRRFDGHVDVILSTEMGTSGIATGIVSLSKTRKCRRIRTEIRT
jgi:hypothetical protein